MPFYCRRHAGRDIPCNMEPVRSNAYRHMLVEARVLRLLGGEFMRRVVELKEKGVKTEPAFARLLGLDGDPYVAVLGLENVSDEDIMRFYVLR